MIRAKYLAAAAMLSMSLSALAVETTYDFESVSKISYGPGGTTIRGVLVNDSVPSSAVILSGGSSCEALIRDMIQNPGMYILSLTIKDEPAQPGGQFPPQPAIVAQLVNCSLEVKP